LAVGVILEIFDTLLVFICSIAGRKGLNKYFGLQWVYSDEPHQTVSAHIPVLIVRKHLEDRPISIIVVDELTLAEPKTRLMAKALNTLVGENSALILIPEKSDAYEGVVRSTRNIPDAKILVASYLNIRDLMTFDRVVLPLAALERIEAQLG
jgi:hypothetical protein